MKNPHLTRHRKPRRNFEQLERRRRLGMKLLGSGLSQAEVARHCQVSETTVFRWKEARAKKGPTAWRRGRLGRPPSTTLKARHGAEAHARNSHHNLRFGTVRG